MTLFSFLFATLFLFALAGNLIGNYRSLTKVTAVSKSLLMPLLLLFFLSSYQSSHHLLIILALLSSFLGDFLLLFNSKRANVCFILGMLCFILTHLFYSLWFLLFASPWKFSPVMLMVVLMLILVTFWFWKTIFATKHKLRILLCLYCLLIDLLVFSSASTIAHGNHLGTFLVFLGALLFGFSDFLIAMRLVGRTVDDNSMVMLSYSLSQLMLICGILILAY
ncbi:MAG: lysoplasmalogenase family protein [Sphaerochaetaceae bacterium]